MAEAKKPAAKPAAKPTVTVKPAAVKPAAVKPVPAKPIAVKPTAAKPSVAKSAAPKAAKKQTTFKNRLHEKYVTEVVPTMMTKWGFKNIMAVPKIDKVIINMGLGDCKDDTKKFQNAVDEIGLITGQKPVVTKAKKSISNFKLRQGQRIGCKVTLRGQRMYEFLDKLISVALPRVRDFRGISTTSFDKSGNYALGIKEQLVFPEISYEKVDKVRGFDICIVTTAKNQADALVLLKEMGFPFRTR